MKKLIVDTILFVPERKALNESYRDDEPFIVTGVLQRANAKNQNGRKYPKKILAREVERYRELIEENRALGECDHADNSIINLKNVSHNIIDVEWNGDDLIGRVQILPTPSGNILKNLLRAGIRLGISSRGMGSVKELAEGVVEVQDDFELICWDFVSNPSTHGAIMFPVHEGMLKESVDRNVPKVDPKIARIHENITNIICEIGDICQCY